MLGLALSSQCEGEGRSGPAKNDHTLGDGTIELEPGDMAMDDSRGDICLALPRLEAIDS